MLGTLTFLPSLACSIVAIISVITTHYAVEAVPKSYLDFDMIQIRNEAAVPMLTALTIQTLSSNTIE